MTTSPQANEQLNERAMSHSRQHFIRALALSFLLFLAAPLLASPLVGEPDHTSGQYRETVTDIYVKVLGGFINWERTWYEGRWHFNPRWAPLSLQRDTATDQLLYIDRSKTRYEPVANNPKLFKFGKRDTIEQTDTGYRWRDHEGNWIDYNPEGLMTRYGDRNNVQVSVTYDAEKRLSGVFDHGGIQRLWHDYDPEGHLIRIRDETSRKVEYGYTGDRLTSVKDVRGHDWLYGYDGDLLTRKTDPEGREVRLTYNGQERLVKVEDPLGVWRQYLYDYDKTRKEFLFREIDSVGKQTDNWYGGDGEMVRQEVNGQTMQTVTRDGSDRRVADRNGLETHSTYDDWGNVTKIRYADGASVSYEYDPQFSRETKYTNENGVVTTYTYDDNGNRVRMVEAVGTDVERTTEYTYDEYGNQLSIRRLGDAVTQEAVTAYTYDTIGNVATLTDPEGYGTTYEYIVTGNVVLKRDARGNDWRKEYDADGSLTAKIDPLNHAIHYTYDEIGNLIKEVDALGHDIFFRYDARNRNIERESFLGKPYQWSYDGEGRVLTEIDEEKKAILVQTYDSEGRSTSRTDGNGNTIRYEYAASELNSDRPARIIYPSYLGSYTYDRRLRLASDTKKLAADEEEITRYSYDDAGRVVKLQDAQGRISSRQYDNLDRLVALVDPIGGVTAFAFDSRGNVVGMTNPNGGTTRYEYDRNDNVTRKISPLGKAWLYRYDAIGQRISEMDPKRQTKIFLFDSAGRLVQIDYYAEAAAAPDKTVAFRFDGNGRLTAYNDGVTDGVVTYNSQGLKVSEVVDYGPFSLEHEYDYYANGKKRSYTGPKGVRYDFGYDKNSLIKSIAIPDVGEVLVQARQWLRRSKIVYPGGAIRQLKYDNLQRVESISVLAPSGEPVQSLGITYGLGNEIAERKTEQGEYKFIYDDLDRLVEVRDPVSSDRKYTLDAQGNRVTDNSIIEPLAYNLDDELLFYAGSSVDYDANGNIIKMRRSSGDALASDLRFQYDAENRLIEVTDKTNNSILSNYYDPFGRRLWRNRYGVRTFYSYSDEGISSELDGNASITREYLFQPGSHWSTDPVFLRDAEGQIFFYHNDDRALPQKLTDINGNVVWSAKWDAFGNKDLLIEAVKNPLGFPGQYDDELAGLYYNFQRYYVADIGRYLTRDPIDLLFSRHLQYLRLPKTVDRDLNGSQDGSDVLTIKNDVQLKNAYETAQERIHPYLYANGNPLSFVDPLGLDGCSPDKSSCISQCVNSQHWMIWSFVIACGAGGPVVLGCGAAVLLGCTRDCVCKKITFCGNSCKMKTICTCFVAEWWGSGYPYDAVAQNCDDLN